MGGQSHPVEFHKKYNFFSNTGPDSLENDNTTKPAFIVGLSLTR